MGCVEEIEIRQRNNQKKHSALHASVTNLLFTRRPRELQCWGWEEEERRAASKIVACNFSSLHINVNLAAGFIFMHLRLKDDGAGGDGSLMANRIQTEGRRSVLVLFMYLFFFSSVLFIPFGPVDGSFL